MEAITLLKKSKESLQSEALRLNAELEELEVKYDATKFAIANVVQRVNDLDTAIKLLERKKDESTSKSKKTK